MRQSGPSLEFGFCEAYDDAPTLSLSGADERLIGMLKVTPVILCGGSGTRLWPLSRKGFPKQFVVGLTDQASLFQQAVGRLMALAQYGVQIASPLVVCSEEHRFLAAEQLRELRVDSEALVLERDGRNTAPALTLAALELLERAGDAVMVVTPSDHEVQNPEAYLGALQSAIGAIADGGVALLGVLPSRPETGYGYIQVDPSGEGVLRVKRFFEKPDQATAQRHLDSGGFYWNAGVFVLKASTWMHALERFRPDVASTVRSAWEQRSTDLTPVATFVRPDAVLFSRSPSVSVDVAVIERCQEGAISLKMLPLDAGWSDLGAWNAVWQSLPKDVDGHVHCGDVLALDCQNTLVHASSRLVSLLGVKDLVVIETPDAVLVADRSRSQDVKAIVEALEASGRQEHLLHRKIHRPWGWYDGVDEGDRFKVKRILIKPKASLSLQKHYHRAEHWIVVKGTAEVTCGDKVQLLTENQSTYIPLGEVHRLHNPGNIPLEIIEVQSGSYLGEDDIIRLEDSYGRGGGE